MPSFGAYSGMATIMASKWQVSMEDLRAARERLWEIERSPVPLGRVPKGRTIRDMLESHRLMAEATRVATPVPSQEAVSSPEPVVPPVSPPEAQPVTPSRAKRVKGVRKDFYKDRVAAAWMDSDPCAYCGEPGDTYDHITPRKRGGGHDEGNLARACSSCNYEKSSRELLMFLTLRAQKKQDGTWTKRAPMSPHFRAIAGRKTKRQ